MTRRVVVAALLLVMVVAWSAMAHGRQAVTAAPAYLQMLEARITEGPPFERAAMAKRRVTFRIVTAGRPPCSPDRAGIEYVFLLDAAPWHRKGVIVQVAPELRVHAKVAMRCDPMSGRFIASVAPGEVTISPAPDIAGGTAIEAATTLQELPSVQFRWVALGTEGSDYVRAPEPGRSGIWRIHERIPQ
jgi:hypothetical protein